MNFMTSTRACSRPVNFTGVMLPENYLENQKRQRRVHDAHDSDLDGFKDAPGRYRLLTMRSNDQFNTTIYGLSGRLRGIEGARDVLLINPEDIARAGLRDGQMVSLVSDADDRVHREVGPLKVTPFKLPSGCVGSYYPEMNPLIALSHHDEKSKTPANNRFRCASGPDAREM
jgi:anaerobic selenocysteine-containing dehydrogenase